MSQTNDIPDGTAGNEEKEIWLRFTIHPDTNKELYKCFNAIKDYLGIDTNTDVVRYSIKQAYYALKKEEKLDILRNLFHFFF